MVPYKNALKSIKATSFPSSAIGSKNFFFFFHFLMSCVIKKGSSYAVSSRFVSVFI